MKNYNKFYYTHLKLINNLLKISFVINFITLFLINDVKIMFFNLLLCLVCLLSYLFNEFFKEHYEKVNKIS